MSTTPPAGWYDSTDSRRPETQRYWDGEGWTDNYRDPPPDITVRPATPQSAGAIVGVGYVLAVLMPLMGFILGIVVATRPAKVTSKHGAWIIVLSVVAFIVWLAIVINAAQHAASTYPSY